MQRTLPLLATANFAAASAGMVIAGILQLIASDLNWSAAQAGQLITTYALGFAIGAPLLGAALGRWCRKQVVILGLALVALGSLCSALAVQSPWLESSRVVVAAGAAMAIPSTSAIAAYLFPNERPRALAFVLAGMTAAIVFGVPIGTLMAGAWGWHAPLFGAAALAAVAAVAIKLLLPGGIVVPPVPLTAWAALLRNRATYPLLGLSLIFIAANFSLYAYIAPFLQDMLGIGAQGLSWLLFLFGLASLGASFVLGPLSERIGAQRLIVLSMIALLVTLALTRFTEGRLWLIVALFVVWAIGNSFFGTLQQARVVEAAPASGSALLALNTSAIFAGQAVGTVIGGWVLATAGLRALPWTGAALAALALLLFAVSRRSRL
jgi:MFS transporter, DHA1 family, inner membrane transport protein